MFHNISPSFFDEKIIELTQKDGFEAFLRGDLGMELGLRHELWGLSHTVMTTNP